MKDYLYIQMWFVISIKIKRSVEDSRLIMTDLKKKHDDINARFLFSDYDDSVKDAFIFYLSSLRFLESK